MLSVLVTSAGRRVQLVRGFEAAMKDLGCQGSVFTADAGNLAAATYLSDGHFTLPRVETPSYEASLLDLCERQSIDLVIPTIDTELPALARMRSALSKKGTTVIVSDPAAITLAADKRKLNRWLKESHLPHTVQYSTHDLQNGTGPDFPIMLKPARGSMSEGVRKIEDETELFSALRGLSSEEWVVERLVPGIEFTISTYVNVRGICVAAVPRERLEVRGGEVSKAKTVANPVLEDTARRVVESLPGARGPLNVQVICDLSSGSLAVIEVNARFGGGDPLAWAAGANAPLWILQEFLGHNVGTYNDWQNGLVMLRYDEAVYRDVDELHAPH